MNGEIETKETLLSANTRKKGTGGTTFRVTLPTKWVRIMGLGEEIRDMVMEFDGTQIIIKKGEIEVKKLTEVLKQLEEEGYDYVIEVEERFDDKIFPIWSYIEDVVNDNVEVEYKEEYVLIKNIDLETEIKVIKERKMNEEDEVLMNELDPNAINKRFDDKVYEQYDKITDRFQIYGTFDDEDVEKMRKLLKD